MATDTEPIQDTSNLGVAKGRPGGYAMVAPAGTDLTALKDVSKTIKELVQAVSGARSLGYISEDGVTFSTDTDTNDNSEWGGKVVDSALSNYAESAQVTFLESRKAVLDSFYGDGNVTVTGATTEIRHNENFTDPHVYVFDAVVSATKVKRSIIPLGRIFERDDVSENSSDMMGYTPTIKCMPYDGYDGDTYRDYIYDAKKAASAGGGA